MKKILIAGAFIISAIISQAQSMGNCNLGIAINPQFSKAAALDSILKYYSTNALPGTALAVYSEAEGWWAGAQGYASVEKKVPMNNCHLQYIQSVSKMYMAVEILQLKEHGKINFDAPVTTYLPAKYSHYISNAAQSTVRMLLNHTSGVPEYNDNPTFVSQVMLHPLDYFTADDCLKSIAGEAPQFAPGSKYRYTNTNYLLLSLIGDAITGDHAAYIKKHIFEPLGLANTYYGLGHDYLNGLHLPESYWDVFNNGKPVNITPFQAETVASSKGDDGIVCTPADAVKFFKGLMEGKLLKPESMKEMFDFVKDEKGHNRYGMGMIYFDLGGLTAYGHGGGGIGAGCVLAYIPSHKIYLFMATNLGVLVESDLAKKADEMKNEILKTLLQ
ncbi:MAG TPA: serine hydrolase domain-containing protein [Chitinophagaceae bacterium]|nr:serine hydrolase domain-containing protein [Chitinophagaceae bacterium]